MEVITLRGKGTAGAVWKDNHEYREQKMEDTGCFSAFSQIGTQSNITKVLTARIFNFDLTSNNWIKITFSENVQ